MPSPAHHPSSPLCTSALPSRLPISNSYYPRKALWWPILLGVPRFCACAPLPRHHSNGFWRHPLKPPHLSRASSLLYCHRCVCDMVVTDAATPGCLGNTSVLVKPGIAKWGTLVVRTIPPHPVSACPAPPPSSTIATVLGVLLCLLIMHNTLHSARPCL